MSAPNDVPPPASVVTLLTDFGLRDPFVGVMKGVMLEINPALQIVDLCHQVEPQNVRQAAFMLMTSCGYFPRGTIHVAVVDPGVGTHRNILACRTDHYYFLVPDNGLLGPTLQRHPLRACVAVSNEDFFRRPVSLTFHGRDIFAPVAAHLSRGLPLEELGPPASPAELLRFPEPRQVDEGRVLGEVLYCDHFGNLITNIQEEDVRRISEDPAGVLITVGGTTIGGLSSAYAAERPGILLAIIGSTGFLEVAVNLGSAQELLGAEVGAPVEVRRVGGVGR